MNEDDAAALLRVFRGSTTVAHAMSMRASGVG